MAVRLEGSIKRFIGTSVDTKPAIGLTAEGVTITANDLPAGSSFLETDTGRIWRYNGIDWVVYAPIDEQAIVLEGILAKLGEILEYMEENI